MISNTRIIDIIHGYSINKAGICPSLCDKNRVFYDLCVPGSRCFSYHVYFDVCNVEMQMAHFFYFETPLKWKAQYNV